MINYIEFLKSGSGIHIKKANKGKFTDYCGGKVTDECIQRGKHSSSAAVRKRATFAANVRKWKHQTGGIIFFNSKELPKYDKEIEVLDFIKPNSTLFETKEELQKDISWISKLRDQFSNTTSDASKEKVNQSVSSITGAPKEFRDKMYTALKEQGVSDRAAKILTAQFALETGYGKHMTGSHNYGNLIATDKWRKETGRQGVKKGKNPRTFREYESFAEAVKDTAKLMKNLYRNDIYTNNTLSDEDYVTTFLNNLNGQDINGNVISQYRWAENNYPIKIREVYNKMWS